MLVGAYYPDCKRSTANRYGAARIHSDKGSLAVHVRGTLSLGAIRLSDFNLGALTKMSTAPAVAGACGGRKRVAWLESVSPGPTAQESTKPIHRRSSVAVLGA